MSPVEFVITLSSAGTSSAHVGFGTAHGGGKCRHERAGFASTIFPTQQLPAPSASLPQLPPPQTPHPGGQHARFVSDNFGTKLRGAVPRYPCDSMQVGIG